MQNKCKIFAMPGKSTIHIVSDDHDIPWWISNDSSMTQVTFVVYQIFDFCHWKKVVIEVRYIDAEF